MKKKLLSIALVLSMLLSLMPITATEASADTTSQSTNSSTKSMSNKNGNELVVDEVNLTIENFGSYTNEYGTYDLDWYIVGYVETDDHTLSSNGYALNTTNLTTDSNGKTITNRTNIALIQCKDSIDAKSFYSNYTHAFWHVSPVRTYLNNNFLANFTDAEQDIILSAESKYINTNQGWMNDVSESIKAKYATRWTPNANHPESELYEKVFILSMADINSFSDFAKDELNPVTINAERFFLSNGAYDAGTYSSGYWDFYYEKDKNGNNIGEVKQRWIDTSGSAGYKSVAETDYYTLDSTTGGTCVNVYQSRNSTKTRSIKMEDDASTTNVVPAMFVDMTKLRQYTVNFDSNSGSNSTSTSLDNVMIGGDSFNFPSQSDVSRAGYILKGWSKDKNATTADYAAGSSYTLQYADNNVITSAGALDYSITYYAVWEKAKFNVTYDLNGGSGTTPTDGTTYYIGDTINLPSSDNFTNGDLYFKGWSTNKNATKGTNGHLSITSDMQDTSITLYAIWGDGYSITYDDNAPYEEIAVPINNNKYKLNDFTRVSYIAPTRSKCTFLGWNTASDGSGATYQPGELIAVDDEITLYAVWKADFAVLSVSASLENNLRLNYMVREEVLDDYENLSLTLNLNGTETVLSSYTQSSGYLVFEFKNIEGKLIGSSISATLSGTAIDGGAEATSLLNYSVKNYCEDLISQYGDDELVRTLAVDILNYGAACQIYNNFNTSALANANLTATQKGWASTDRSSSYTSSLNTDSAKSSDGKYAIAGAQMLLEDAINMQIMVYAEDTSNVSLQFWNGSTKIATVSDFSGTVKYNKKTYQVVDFRGLNAYQLSDAITIKLFKGSAEQCSIVYSMESYATAKVDAESQDGEKEAGVTNLGQLIKAVMAYGDGASEYVGQYRITSTSPVAVASSSNPSYVDPSEAASTKTLTYTAANGYILPTDSDSVTVTGATKDSWGVTNGTGTLTISNITGNVEIYIEGTQDGYFATSSNYVGKGFTANSYGTDASGYNNALSSMTYSGVYVTEVALPSGTTSICDYAFSYIDWVTDITIPTTVSYIGEGAFEECSNLTNINYNGTTSQWLEITKSDNWNSSTGDYMVYCTNGKVTKDGTAVLSSGYYNSNGKLLKVLTLDTAGTDAGGVLSNMPDGTTNIILPDGVTSIKGDALLYARNLTSITIPSSVTSIGNAFYGCDKLSTLVYLGTKTAWYKSVSRDSSWADGLASDVGEYSIVCTNGTVSSSDGNIILDICSGVTADGDNPTSASEWEGVDLRFYPQGGQEFDVTIEGGYANDIYSSPDGITITYLTKNYDSGYVFITITPRSWW